MYWIARTGEAGAEGLLPLDIDSKGQLAVSATDLRSGTTIGNVNLNITTENAESFRGRSRRQIESDASAIAGNFRG